jgi:hypothetical protein
MRRAMMLLGGNSEGAAEVAGMTQQPGDIRAKGVWAAGETAIKRDVTKASAQFICDFKRDLSEIIRNPIHSLISSNCC